MRQNDKILLSLIRQCDELYDQLVSQKLTDIYLEEYTGLKDGSILFINETGIDVDFEELLEHDKRVAVIKATNRLIFFMK